MFTFNGYSKDEPDEIIITADLESIEQKLIAEAIAEAKAVQIMNCVHCGKPIRQATIEELEGINVPPLEWYKHIEGEGLWSCYNGGNFATAGQGTKWIGSKPVDVDVDKYKPILVMPKFSSGNYATAGQVMPKLTQEVPKIRKPREKKKKVLPEPVGRKFRF